MNQDSSNNYQPLGKILQNAGLISNYQTKIALNDQNNQDLRVGEALAIRGWIAQQTADFFAEDWHYLLKQENKHPLGYYLEQSGLLTHDDIDSILREQNQIWVKFGSVAILQGLLEQQTVDFFLNNLFPFALCYSPLIGRKNNNLVEPQSSETREELSNCEVDYDDIPWID